MVTDQDPWLLVDLREQMEVTSVATQGRYDSWDWVTSYQLLYSDTGRVWKEYRQEDGVGVSPCSFDPVFDFFCWSWKQSCFRRSCGSRGRGGCRCGFSKTLDCSQV